MKFHIVCLKFGYAVDRRINGKATGSVIFCCEFESITNMICLFCNLLGGNDPNWQAWKMENLSNDKFNILPLIILKYPTKRSATCKFDLFRDAILWFCSNFHLVLHMMKHQNRQKSWKSWCQKVFFFNVYLKQDSSIDLFVNVNYSLDG